MIKRKARKIKLADTIVSLIVVTKNDEDIIEAKLKEIKKTLSLLGTSYEIITVDNASVDATVEKIKRLRGVMPYTRIVVLSREYHPEIALTAGLEHCIGDFAILFNIYLDPPETIPQIIDRLTQGYDIVIGKPKENRNASLQKLFIGFVEKVSSQGFFYQQSYLTGLTRRAINSITRTRRKSRHLAYINALIGLKRDFLPYSLLTRYQKRVGRRSFPRLVTEVVDIIISNSFRPIKIVSFVGVLLSLLFLLWVFGVVILVLFFGKTHIAPKGWISLATVVGTLFFLLFSLLAIISEYIIRILHETRDEPFYFVSEEIDKSTILPKKDKMNVV